MEINPKKKPKENNKAMSLSGKWALLPSQDSDRKPGLRPEAWTPITEIEIGSVRGMMDISTFSLTNQEGLKRTEKRTMVSLYDSISMNALSTRLPRNT